MSFWEYLRNVADKVEEASNSGNILEVRRLLGLCGNACLGEKEKLDKQGGDHE